MKYYKVYDGSNELFKVRGSRDLQRELGKLWVFNILKNNQYTIEDCKTNERFSFDEIYGCNLEHNLHNPDNVGCCDDCVNCTNHKNFLGE